MISFSSIICVACLINTLPDATVDVLKFRTLDALAGL